MNTERRTLRSNQPHIALALYLRAEAHRCDARALAIGTLDGLPIASWGAEDESLLAAVGSMFAGGDQAQARHELDDVDATLIDSGFGQLVLTSRGVRAETIDIDRHVNRILS